MDPLDDNFDELLQLQNEIENEQMNQFNNSFHNENPYLDELFNPYDDQIELLNDATKLEDIQDIDIDELNADEGLLQEIDAKNTEEQTKKKKVSELVHYKPVYYDIPPENCDVQALTLLDGRFVFIKVNDTSLESSDISKSSFYENTISNFDELYDQVQEKIIEKNINAAQEEEIDTNQESQTIDSQLWTDKYSPKLFKELISDERQNRRCLNWFKQWKIKETIRFSRKEKEEKTQYQSFFDRKKEFKTVEKETTKEEESEITFNYQKYKPKSKKKAESIMCTICGRMGHSAANCYLKKYEVPDTPYDHPLQPVLVIYGPSGTCKTTLINVCAKHVHMNVFNMNSLLTNEKHAATAIIEQMDMIMKNGSLSFQEGSPLLLFDDFDILYNLNERQAILNHINELCKQLKDHHESGSKTVGLRLPIVIICSSIYAANISIIQNNYFPLYIPPISALYLQNRLSYICQEEQIKYNSLGLQLLSDYTHGDIRQSISLLQTISKKKVSITQNAAFFSILQEKITVNNMNDLLHYIFTSTKMKNHYAEMKDMNYLHLYQHNYDTDTRKLFDAIYAYIPKVQLYDPRLTKYTNSLDWLLFGYDMETMINMTNDYSFQQYYFLIPSSIHLYYQREGKPKFNRDTFFYRLFSKQYNNKMIGSQFLQSYCLATKQLYTMEAVVLDIVSILLSLLVPTFKPIETRLLNMKEKQQLYTIIDLMATYNLRYASSKELNDEMNYKKKSTQNDLDVSSGINLVPDLSSLVHYSQLTHPFSSVTTIQKMKIQSELTKHLVLKESSSKPASTSSSGLPPVSPIKSTSSSGLPPVSPTKPKSSSPLKRNLMEEIAKEDEKKTKKTFSFMHTNEEEAYEKIHGITFRYVKGYTNAVRCRVTIDDLL